MLTYLILASPERNALLLQLFSEEDTKALTTEIAHPSQLSLPSGLLPSGWSSELPDSNTNYFQRQIIFHEPWENVMLCLGHQTRFSLFKVVSRQRFGCSADPWALVGSVYCSEKAVCPGFKLRVRVVVPPIRKVWKFLLKIDWPPLEFPRPSYQQPCTPRSL